MECDGALSWSSVRVKALGDAAADADGAAEAAWPPVGAGDAAGAVGVPHAMTEPANRTSRRRRCIRSPPLRCAGELYACGERPAATRTRRERTPARTARGRKSGTK